MISSAFSQINQTNKIRIYVRIDRFSKSFPKVNLFNSNLYKKKICITKKKNKCSFITNTYTVFLKTVQRLESLGSLLDKEGLKRLYYQDNVSTILGQTCFVSLFFSRLRAVRTVHNFTGPKTDRVLVVYLLID